MNSLLDRPFTALAVLMVAMAATDSIGESTAAGSFERTVPVAGPIELDVKAGSGRIEVRAGEAGSVRIRGIIRARGGWLGGGENPGDAVRRLESSPPIEQDGEVIRVGHLRDPGGWNSVSISYEIVAPIETRLRSRSGSGSQAIEGIRGPVNAGAGSGSIRATGIAGHFSASTGSGSIYLDQAAAGDVEVKSGSGRIDLTGVRGSLRARSSSGRISVNHPITFLGSLGRREVAGRVRNGGPRLEVTTSSGGIRID